MRDDVERGPEGPLRRNGKCQTHERVEKGAKNGAASRKWMKLEWKRFSVFFEDHKSNKLTLRKLPFLAPSSSPSSRADIIQIRWEYSNFPRIFLFSWFSRKIEFEGEEVGRQDTHKITHSLPSLDHLASLRNNLRVSLSMFYDLLEVFFSFRCSVCCRRFVVHCKRKKRETRLTIAISLLSLPRHELVSSASLPIDIPDKYSSTASEEELKQNTTKDH